MAKIPKPIITYSDILESEAGFIVKLDVEDLPSQQAAEAIENAVEAMVKALQ